MEKSEILIYQSPNGLTKIDVRLEEETVWLNQYQLAELFQTDRTSIAKHIKNIYETGELIEASTCAKIAQVQLEGNRKVCDIFATSVDYDVQTDMAKRFFATIQNKFHWAIHAHTAAELIVARANADKPNMGLTNWPSERIKKQDVVIAKNYLESLILPNLCMIITCKTPLPIFSTLEVLSI